MKPLAFFLSSLLIVSLLHKLQQVRRDEPTVTCDCGCGATHLRHAMIPVQPKTANARLEYVTPKCYSELYQGE